MKLIFSLVNICISIISFGQHDLPKNVSTNETGKLVVYVDSILTEFEYFNIDSNNIEKVDVIKNKKSLLSNFQAQIFITSKNPEKYHFLSTNSNKNIFQIPTNQYYF